MDSETAQKHTEGEICIVFTYLILVINTILYRNNRRPLLLLSTILTVL